jgi:hypothetical protein
VPFRLRPSGCVLEGLRLEGPSRASDSSCEEEAGRIHCHLASLSPRERNSSQTEHPGTDVQHRGWGPTSSWWDLAQPLRKAARQSANVGASRPGPKLEQKHGPGSREQAGTRPSGRYPAERVAVHRSRAPGGHAKPAKKGKQRQTPDTASGPGLRQPQNGQRSMQRIPLS